jgi:hypothetical protein
MEVPGEYLDSRKSSSQQSEPRNKLSRPRQPEIEIIDEEPPLTPSNPPELPSQSLSKTEKKGERADRHKAHRDDEVREGTLKLSDEGQHSPDDYFETIDNEATMKDK